MHYVSIDIETTGLDKDKHQIVEVGAVIDSLGSTTPLEDLPKFRAVLIHDEMQMGPYCANLHKGLWAEIQEIIKDYGKPTYNKWVVKNKSTIYCCPEIFEHQFKLWLKNYFKQDIADNAIHINVAGKNAGSFDIPFIKSLPGWQGLIKFHRRVLDPTIFFALSNDNYLPDLQECLKRCKIYKGVSHTAVDDALDVVMLIRAGIDNLWEKQK